MAEKFICVRKYDSPCEKCEVKKICGRDCVFKEMFEKDPYKITRKEAIEKIAKALIDIALTGHYSRFEDSCVVEDAIPYAKAALNALLRQGE